MRWHAVAVVALLAAGCLDVTERDGDDAHVPFTLDVIPAGIVAALPGQHLVFMVTLQSADPDPVSLAALSDGRTLSVQPGAVQPGVVAEVGVDVPASAAGAAITLIVSGQRDGRGVQVQVPISTATTVGEPPMEDAVALHDRFATWLAEEHPGLGIINQTRQSSVARPPDPGVAAYTFYGEEWEMGIRWNRTSPPDDWAEAYLRERFSETAPGMAWRIDSWQADPPVAPRPMEPPASVWR